MHFQHQYFQIKLKKRRVHWLDVSILSLYYLAWNIADAVWSKHQKKKPNFWHIERILIINLIIKRDYIIDLPSRHFHDPLSLTIDVKGSDKSSGM